MNKILIVAIFSIVFVALAGAASANPTGLDGLTVTADTIQTNGNYIGIPTVINGETYTYGYNYTFIPDGTYTVFGTITNTLNYGMVVHVEIGDKDAFKLGSTNVHGMTWTPVSTDVYVPAAGDKPATVGYSLTLPAGYVSSAHDISGIYETNGNVHAVDLIEIPDYFYEGPIDFKDNYVDAPQGVHTVDQGPMSNMVVIFNNGVLSANASIVYTLNQSGDDYKALYTNGKIDFHGSPLYSFAE